MSHIHTISSSSFLKNDFPNPTGNDIKHYTFSNGFFEKGLRFSNQISIFDRKIIQTSFAYSLFLGLTTLGSIFNKKIRFPLLIIGAASSVLESSLEYFFSKDAEKKSWAYVGGLLLARSIQLGLFYGLSSLPVRQVVKRILGKREAVFKGLAEHLRGRVPGFLQEVMPPKWAMVLGGSFLAVGAHDIIVPECDEYIERLSLWNLKRQGNYGKLVSKLTSDEECLQLRAIDSLSDLLFSHKLNDNERKKVIATLKPIAKQDENQNLKQAAQVGLSKAVKWQKALLALASQQQHGEKVSNSVAELVHIGTVEALTFLQESPTLSFDTKEVALNYIKNRHWKIYLRMLVEKGRLSQAIKHQIRQIRQFKSSSNNEYRQLAQAYTELGHLYRMKDELNQARKVYQQAIDYKQNDYEPHHYEALNGLGEISLEKNEGKIALGWFDKAARLVPDHTYTWKLSYNRSLASLIQGNTAGASNILVTALQGLAGQPIEEKQWGRFYYTFGDLDEALKYLQRSLERLPSAEVQNDLAVVLTSQGKIEKALEAYEAGHKLDENNLSLLANFLFALGTAKQYRKAYNLTEKLLANPYSHILSEFLKENVFNLKNREFSDYGDESMLIKLPIQLNDISSNPFENSNENLGAEIDIWKRILSNRHASVEEKKQAVVVLDRLADFDPSIRLDLALEITRMVPHPFGEVGGFATIAVSRMTAGLTGDQLGFFIDWLSQTVKESEEETNNSLRSEVAKRVYERSDVETLLKFSEKYRQMLIHSDASQRLKGIWQLSDIVTFLPRDKKMFYMRAVLKKLKDSDRLVRFFTPFFYLGSGLQSLKKEEVKELAESAYSIAKEEDKDFSDTAFIALCPIFVHLPEDEQIEYESFVYQKLASSDPSVRDDALFCFLFANPRSEEKSMEYALKVLDKVNDPDIDVRKSAFSKLAIMSHQLKDTYNKLKLARGLLKFTSLQWIVPNQLFSAELKSDFQSTLYHSLSTLTPAEAKKLAELESEDLKHQSGENRFNALLRLSEIIRFLDSQNQKKYIRQMIRHLKYLHESDHMARVAAWKALLNPVLLSQRKDRFEYFREMMAILKQEPHSATLYIGAYVFTLTIKAKLVKEGVERSVLDEDEKEFVANQLAGVIIERPESFSNSNFIDNELIRILPFVSSQKRKKLQRLIHSDD